MALRFMEYVLREPSKQADSVLPSMVYSMKKHQARAEGLLQV